MYFYLILGGVLTCAYNSTRSYRNNNGECVLKSIEYKTRNVSEMTIVINTSECYERVFRNISLENETSSVSSYV